MPSSYLSLDFLSLASPSSQQPLHSSARQSINQIDVNVNPALRATDVPGAAPLRHTAEAGQTCASPSVFPPSGDTVREVTLVNSN